MSIDEEVQRRRCAVDIEDCCGSSNEASFVLAAVVSVQMAVQMTVRSRKRSRTVHVLLRAWKVLGRAFGRQVEPTRRPRAPSWARDASKMCPRGAQEPSSWAQEASKSVKLGPRGTREAPSCAQDVPKRLQGESKRRPRAPS